MTHPKKPTGPELTATQIDHFGIDNRPPPPKSTSIGQMVCFLLQNPSNLHRPMNQVLFGEICQFLQDLYHFGKISAKSNKISNRSSEISTKLGKISPTKLIFFSLLSCQIFFIFQISNIDQPDCHPLRAWSIWFDHPLQSMAG